MIGEAEPHAELLGREDLLEEVRAALERHRLVTLTGPGGAGKSTLAEAIVEAARSSRESFFIDLTSLRDGSGFTSALVAQLVLGSEQDPDGLVAEWAGSRQALLALDNLEQAPGVAEPVMRLLGNAPGVRVLATSRVPLGARGEYEIRVPSLVLPANDDPPTVEAAPASSLFLQRARELGALRGELTADVAADVAGLCRMLDGLPLALELAAARTRVMSPGAIRRRLDARDVSVLRRAGGDLRHGSLEAILEWTIGLLSDAEIDTLRACACCYGSFDLALISRLTSGDALLTTERLVMYGLVVTDEEVAGEPRFRLLESIRITVLASLDDGLRRFAKDHAEAMLISAREQDDALDGSQARMALARLDADRSNLAAAIEWAVAHDPSLACRLLWATAAYWDIRGAVGQPARQARDLLQDAALRREDRALALGALLRLLSHADNEDESPKVAVEAAPLARDLGLHAVELEALTHLALKGQLSGLRGDRQAALERIVAISPETDRDALLVGFGHFLLAEDREGIAGARRYVASEAAKARAAGRPRHLGIWLANLTWESLLLHDARAAVAAADECLGVAADLGESALESYCLGKKAIALSLLGDDEGASSSISRSLRLAAARVRTPIVEALVDRATIAVLTGDSIGAAWFLGAAEKQFDPTPVGVFGEGDGFSAEWNAARRSVDPVAWELAQREGRAATDDEVLERALRPLTGDARPGTTRGLRHGVLTAREIEILTLVSDGLTDGAIAERLFISPKTASVHVANAKAKLGAETRLDLALRARELLGVAPSASSPRVA